MAIEGICQVGEVWDLLAVLGLIGIPILDDILRYFKKEFGLPKWLINGALAIFILYRMVVCK